MNKYLTGYVALMFVSLLAFIPAWGHANAGESIDAPIMACQEYWHIVYRSPEFKQNKGLNINSYDDMSKFGCKQSGHRPPWVFKHSKLCDNLSTDKDFVAIIKEARKLSARLAELASLTNDLKEDAIQTKNADERKDRIKKAGIGFSDQKEDGVKTEKKEMKKSGIRVPGPDGRLVDKAELDEEY